MVAADEFKEGFEIFDPEKTGGLDAEACGNVMRSLGQNPSMKEVEDLFAKHSKASTRRPGRRLTHHPAD